MKATEKKVAQPVGRFGNVGAYRYVVYGASVVLLVSIVAFTEWQRRSYKSTIERMEGYHLATVSKAIAVSENIHVVEHAIVARASEIGSSGVKSSIKPFFAVYPDVRTVLHSAEAALDGIIETQSVFRDTEFEELGARTERQFSDLEANILDGLDLRSDVESAQRQLAGLALTVEQLRRFHTLRHAQMTQALPLQNNRRIQLLIVIVITLLAISFAFTRQVFRFIERVTDALSKSKEHYRALLESAPDAIVIVDQDARIVMVNSQAVRMFGYSREDFVGQPIEMLIPPRYHDRHRQQRRQFLKLPTLRSMGDPLEFWGFRKDGNEFPVEISLSPIDTKKGVLVSAFIRDITDRKRTEIALRKSEEQYRILLENHVDGVGVVVDGKIVYANKPLCDLVGYTMEELQSSSPLDFVVLGDRERAGQDIVAIIEGRIERDLSEYTLVRKDGVAVPVDIASRSIQFDGKLAMLSVIRDITKRKVAEEARQVSEKRLDEFFSSAPVGMALFDDQLRYMKINATLAEINGILAKEHIGKTFQEVVPHIAPKINAMYRRILTTGESVLNLDVSGEVPSQPGVERHWISSQFRIPGNKPEVFTLGAIVVEITDHKQAEEELRQLQENLAHALRISTMGEMATGIAHELNQPLSAIATYSFAADSIAEQIDACPDKLREILGKIEDQSIRAGDIVRRLRQFGSKTDAVRVTTDLNSLVRDVAKFVEPDTKRAEAMLLLEFDERSPKVLIDEIQVQQVLVNLIRNAIDAMEEIPVGRRKVTVSTRTLQEGQAEVTVSDVGKGIAKDEFEHVFDAFFSTKEQGMGLGLRISRTIVEAHGGRLWAKPNNGAGVTFAFTIPMEVDA